MKLIKVFFILTILTGCSQKEVGDFIQMATKSPDYDFESSKFFKALPLLPPINSLKPVGERCFLIKNNGSLSENCCYNQSSELLISKKLECPNYPQYQIYIH